MVTVDRSALVEFSAERMYALVDDVEAYPRFLPWCSDATVTSHHGGTRTLATIHVNYRGIREKFTTENSSEPGRVIEMQLVSGPFRQLRGQWRFTPLEANACKVELRLEYEITSRLLKRIMGPVFHHIADTLVHAFVRRAQQIYAGG